MSLLAAFMMACSPSGGASRGGAASDSGAAVANAASSRVEPHAPRATDSVAPSAGDTTPTVGVRATGRPQRARREPRSSGCGGTFVNVTVKAAALEHSTLERVAGELLAPVRADVGAPSLSPAIRAFRVPVRDSAAAGRVMARLRASTRVEGAEIDGCGVRIEREPREP